MDDNKLDAFMEIVAEFCGQAIIEKRYHESIIIGTLGYALFHEAKHPKFANGALGFVSDAIALSDNRTPESQVFPNLSKEPSCSFCGQRESEVRLGAGPGVFICESCVGTLSEVFSKDKGSDDQT